MKCFGLQSSSVGIYQAGKRSSIRLVQRKTLYNAFYSSNRRIHDPRWVIRPQNVFHLVQKKGFTCSLSAEGLVHQSGYVPGYTSHSYTGQQRHRALRLFALSTQSERSVWINQRVSSYNLVIASYLSLTGSCFSSSEST